jgi:hypothetical protein
VLGYGKRSFVEPFLRHHGGHMATPEEILANTTQPMAVSGITKRIIPNHATRTGLDWWYIDTGYMGNRASHKTWFRVTKNATQNTGPIKNRPGHRLQRFNIDREQYQRGSRIVLVPPDAKVCDFFQLPDLDTWIRDVTQQISSQTDRPVVLRHRPPSRHDRSHSDRFIDFIQDNTHVVVTWTSNCAVESVIHGIPVICLGPSAALPVASRMEDIDQVPDLDPDLVEAWLRHLSFCQFNLYEMRSGAAWRFLNE